MIVFMLNYLRKSFLELNKKTKQILKNGWKFCFIICIISLVLLVTYNIFVHNILFYRLGISLFKLSMIFAIEFLICGYVVDSIKKGGI